MNETNEHNPDGLTPKTDALFTDIFGPERDWTPNQKKAAKLARDLEQELAESNAIINLQHKAIKTGEQRGLAKAEEAQSARIAELEAGEQILWSQLAERDEVNAQLRARIAELERELSEHKDEWDRLEMTVEEAHALRAEVEGLTKERDEARANYEEEKAIVNRVWKALGIETYEQAKPFAIDEHVAKLRAQLANL